MTDSDTLYLASTSPRRRQLLAEAGLAFELFAISVDEEALSEAYQGPLNRLGEYLARQKAVATYAALQAAGKPGRALAADTTVLLGETHLAKPADFEEGRADAAQCCADVSISSPPASRSPGRSRAASPRPLPLHAC